MNETTQKLSFQDIVNQSISNVSSGTIVTSSDIILALLCSLLCSFIIVWTYKKSYQGVIYQKSFSIAIIMTCLITTSIIMIISGNLILSLGMVGALSIIRFRSAIKDPLDIVFMFWAVSAGIANGIANFKVAFISSVFIALVIFLLKDSRQKEHSYMLICKYSGNLEDEIFNAISELSKRYVTKSKTIKDNEIELIIEVLTSEKNSQIPNKLLELNGVVDASMISYSNNLLDK